MLKKQLRILVAPLDWGMGHVTRCIPLIRHIRSLGHEVIFAGNNAQQSFIKSIFGDIEFVYLEGYNVTYSRNRRTFLLKIIGQIPSIQSSVRRERAWLSHIVKEKRLDAVISDNRYGLFHPEIPCVILTHQLQVLSGSGNPFDMLLLKAHYRYLEKFRECWVVDVADKKNNLSGKLGHPSVLPSMNIRYIGLLSQFATTNPSEETDEILILLSGAEPQRSILSEQLWKKAVTCDYHCMFVAGSEQAEIPDLVPDHITFVQRLSGSELSREIAKAAFVICRSGYSSIMDLIALRKKGILIPTPGQTEQEYLAKRMHERGLFMKAKQTKFDIDTSVVNAGLFQFRQRAFGAAFEIHKQVLTDWLRAMER
ncbi:MAG: glycosyltransferase [Chitinophagaceae bacterium]